MRADPSAFSKVWYNETCRRFENREERWSWHIAKSNPDNVILFPKTIEYAQNELTGMLEGERYTEAARLLEFLLQCHSGDPQHREEWQALFDWLSATFPHSVETRSGAERGDPDLADDEDKEETENELFVRHIRAKAAGDPQFADKLFAMLGPEMSAEKQMTALAQLACLDRSSVGERLKEWLTQSRLHPLVQFRGLQALRSVGDTGTIEIRKLGQTLCLRVGDTPLAYGQFPASARAVLDKCRKVTEAKEPALADLAQTTWRDFLAFVYGTSVYDELLSLDEDGADQWAAALHHTSQETLYGCADESGVFGWYKGAAQGEPKRIHRAMQVLKLFASVSVPGHL